MNPDNDTAVFWNKTVRRRTAKWLYGLIGGIVGAMAGSMDSTLALMVVAPETFNIHALWKTLSTGTILGGLAGLKIACAYLMKSPVPGPTGDTEIITRKDTPTS